MFIAPRHDPGWFVAIDRQADGMFFLESLGCQRGCHDHAMFFRRIPSASELGLFLEIKQYPPIASGRSLKLTNKEFILLGCTLPMNPFHRIIRSHLAGI